MSDEMYDAIYDALLDWEAMVSDVLEHQLEIQNGPTVISTPKLKLNMGKE